MSDRSMYELEDIVWHEFGSSDDHIVPRPGGTTLINCVHEHDCLKRPQSEAAKSVRRSAADRASVLKNVLEGKEKTTFHSTLEDGKATMLEKGSWSHAEDTFFAAACDSGCIISATGLVPVDMKMTSNCFKNSKVDLVGNEFCTADPILGNGGEAVDNNLCHFPLDDISAAESELEFFGNGDDQKENRDLLDYGWPDIGNFEDVDRMFRNCDSTFGQGNTGSINELSWFSTSSHDLFEDTPESGFRSSSSEGKVLKSTPEHHETDPKYMPLQQNAQWKQSKSRDQLEGKRKYYSSEYLDGTLHNSGLAHQFSDLKPTYTVPYSSQYLSQQSQFRKANSFRDLHGYIPYRQQEYEHPSHQFPVTPTVWSIESKTKNHPLSCEVSRQASSNVPPVDISADRLSELSTAIPEGQLKMLHDPQQIQNAMSNKHRHDQFVSDGTFTDRAPIQKKLHQFEYEVGSDSEVEEMGVEFAATEIDSAPQEISCMSAVLFNEISLEATSFWQLQDVMEQLDIRTKLCIRDSLYRLARSAEQRHNFRKANSRSKKKRGQSGTPAEEESNKHDKSQCLGFMDPETDTNPIDRSIAHLLFYRPSRPSTRPSNDALSVESHVITHGSSQPAMHDQLVCQEDISDDMDMNLPIAKK